MASAELLRLPRCAWVSVLPARAVAHPTEEAIEPIASRRPYDDPRGEDFPYRLERESGFLELPTAKGSDGGIIGPWREYAKKEERYLQDKSAWLASRASERGRPDLKWIWDGEGSDPNAALTVFRHFDSATVVKGLLGEVPKTGWVIGYPLLERIHYLLVAGFDVYGNVGHQLLSRLYMDFLRMEGEFNFLSFLPSEQRLAVRDSNVLREGRELLPEENTLSVARGFVGACPNAIDRVQRPQIRELAHAIGQLGSEDDHRVLADRFAVRRSDPAFWPYRDELQATHLKLAPLTAGLLDYDRLENR